MVSLELAILVVVCVVGASVGAIAWVASHRRNYEHPVVLAFAIAGIMVTVVAFLAIHIGWLSPNVSVLTTPVFYGLLGA